MRPLALALLLSAAPAGAHRLGIFGRAEVGCGGGACHDAKGVPPTLEWDVPQQVAPGEQVEIALRVEGPGQAAGCNVAADAGTLGPLDDALRVYRAELTHREPTPYEAGERSFRFAWTAPAEDAVVTLRAAANNVDVSGDPTGDAWWTAEARIRVGEGVAPEDIGGGAGCSSAGRGTIPVLFLSFLILNFRSRRAD